MPDLVKATGLKTHFKVFFPQIIERKKKYFMESDRSRFKFWVCQIFTMWPCYLSPSNSQFPHLQNGDNSATSQLEMSIDWFKGQAQCLAQLRLLNQQTSYYSTNASQHNTSWPESLSWSCQGMKVSFIKFQTSWTLRDLLILYSSWCSLRSEAMEE